jgi:hypothetical protein
VYLTSLLYPEGNIDHICSQSDIGLKIRREVIYSCFVMYIYYLLMLNWQILCRGRDRMVVGFTTTYAISAYHH